MTHGLADVPALRVYADPCREVSQVQEEPGPAARRGAVSSGSASPASPPPPSGLAAVPRVYLLGFAALALAIITGVLVWGSRTSVSTDLGPPPTSTTPEPWSLDLTGRWQGKVTTTITGSPARPALREMFIETDRSGNVVAAGVTLTDPGRGGAGAGYLTVPDGGRRVRALASALAASPAGASLTLDFIPFAPWVPRRDRTWRAVEGLRKTPEETTYLLVESREPDYLIQAGVNATRLSVVPLPVARLRLGPRHGRALEGDPPGPRQLPPRIPQPRLGPLRLRRLRDPPGRGHDLGTRGARPTGSRSAASRPPEAAYDRDDVPAALGVLLHREDAAGARRPRGAPRTTCSRSTTR